ncbi:adenylate cyclase [Mangrovibacterium diazotrophicum]|uniref:Adenylate cyclase n=2 Tax=Mangrovibacterium diazotrophicum TaxID=1261403 RepID=A0A419VUF7_9BACT|nr:adenylate cyclase [Mangrovibacterium diazotrophicum]
MNQKQNLKFQTLWLVGKLFFNLIAWAILTGILFLSVFLLQPDIGTNGARFFQVVDQNHVVPLLLSSLMALFTWLIEDVVLYRYLSRKSMGVVFLYRFLVLMLLVVFVFLVVSAYHYHNKIFTDIDEYLLLLKWFFISRTSAFLFIMAVFISMIINMFKAIRQKVGALNFFKIVSGYYRKPREEERIFIFIDLISSTKYAEQLGHRQYSKFLQKCFEPLGLLEIKYRAMQYQIIGDEVVLTWYTKNIQNFRHAVKLYYEFSYMLNCRQEEFKKEFGIIPNFTASINSGKIMVSEVGSIKSEIAFHGDVLNTAARIQKQCKSYNRQLLVTKTFATKFEEVGNGFKIEWIAKDLLIGKKHKVDIFAIEIENELEVDTNCMMPTSTACN